MIPTPVRNFVQPLGHGPMDDIHAELDTLLGRAGTVEGETWACLLAEIDAHLRYHFEAENRWMMDTDFPPRDCHIEEHNAVLHSSAEVLARAQGGDTRAAGPFVQALKDWFPAHADHLDSALAAWMTKQQYGGKPVVLHWKAR